MSFPVMNAEKDHKSTILERKYWCLDQKALKWNDLFFKDDEQFLYIEIGQLLEPKLGMIDTLSGNPDRNRALEVKNLYNLGATWGIPPLLMFQVNAPFVFSMSILLQLSIKALKESETSSCFLIHPLLLSLRDRIMLKSPAMIHGVGETI